jgi:HEAT repeat protein
MRGFANDQGQRKTLNIRYPKKNWLFDRPMPDFSSYLEAVGRHYEPWCRLYTPIDAVEQADRMELFDFGFMVQTIVPQKDDPRETLDRAEKVERFTVLEGLRKYAGEQVLLVGRPGSGKSTALTQLLLQEAQQNGDCIPVLVELRYWNDDEVMGLIRSFLMKFGVLPEEVDRTTLEELLRSKKLLLLMDGLNELPSEAARQDVRRFRREFSGVAIVFTTRELGGESWGIEKQLEMQPLTPVQMKAFVMAYLPEQGEAMVRQLGERLREFGSTPLLLWMLCRVFAKEGRIPENLGEVFRVFTRGYERRVKQDVVGESDRRLWGELLKQLASRMMMGEKPTELRVAIGDGEIYEVFSSYLNTSDPLVPRQALDDLLRHHLIQRNGELVEFRHQLIQEYYAAEWLLERLGRLDDETLKGEFLNYLKWTESIALMLALVEDEGLAVRVVERALEVDLMLGARLAGEVRSDFQIWTTDLVTEFNLPSWLKVNLLMQIGSEEAVLNLLQVLEYGNIESRWRAAEALGEIGSAKAIPRLFQAMEHANDNLGLRWSASEALEKIHFDEITDLFKMLEHPDCYVRQTIVKIFGKLGSEQVIPDLLKALEDSDPDVRKNATNALSTIGSEQAISGLLNALESNNSCVRGIAAEGLGRIGSEQAIPGLLNALERVLDLRGGILFTRLNDFHSCDARRRAAYALGEIGSEQAIVGLIKALEDTPHNVRSSIAEALGKIGSEQAVPALIKLLEDDEGDVRSSAVWALGEVGSELALLSLLKTLEDDEENVRSNAAEALGKIGSELAIPYLLKALEDDKGDVGSNAARALGKLGSEQAIPYLLKVIEDNDKDLRAKAVWVLGQIGYNAAIPRLLRALEDNDSNVQRLAAWALGEIGSKTAIPGLLKALEDNERDVRWRVAWALGEIASERTIPGLFKLIEDDDRDLRESAAKALSKFKDDRAAHILPNLLQLLPTESGKEAFEAIQGIQSNCKFYNYEIQQAKLRKAVQPCCLEENRASLGGGGGKTIINQFPNATEVKIFENIKTYHGSPPRDPPN